MRAAAARWRRDARAARGHGEALGEGVWRRAHDRFLRGVDRYHQVMEGVPAGPARDHLEREGARLAAALDAVLVTCVAAQRAHPSAGLDVPGGAAGRGPGGAAGRGAGAAPGGAVGGGAGAAPGGAVGGGGDPRDLHRRLSRAAGLTAQAAEAAAMVRVAVAGGLTDDDVLAERLRAVTLSVDRTLAELG